MHKSRHSKGQVYYFEEKKGAEDLSAVGDKVCLTILTFVDAMHRMLTLSFTYLCELKPVVISQQIPLIKHSTNISN